MQRATSTKIRFSGTRMPWSLLRARITGHNKNGLLRYRHADGRRCRSTRKSTLAEAVEAAIVEWLLVTSGMKAA